MDVGGIGPKLLNMIELAKDMHDKHAGIQAAIFEEMLALLDGKPGIGARMKQLGDRFGAAWAARYAKGDTARKYVWNKTSDGPMLNRLARALSDEDLEKRILRYISDPDQFLAKERHPFSLFARNINRYADEGSDLFQPLEERPSECQHDPPCTTDAEHTRRRAAELRA